jgi:hypothetical protein
MRTTAQKNIISTSFELDLSTIDKKVNKLVKYLKNCSIDLNDDGKKFINPQQSYDSIVSSLDKRKYKESLSILVKKVYLQRFSETKENLIKQGLVTNSDLIIAEPIDDFGSKFDAFAATNTDPNNTILQLLETKPYKSLKIDIFEEEEIKTYLKNVSAAVYDYSNMIFLLTKLDSLADTYINLDPSLNPNYEVSVEEYVREVKEKVLYIKNSISTNTSGSVSGSQNGKQEYLYSLPEKIPGLKNAEDLIESYTDSTPSRKEIFPFGTFPSLVDSGYQLQEIINVIGEKAYNDSISKKQEYDFKIIVQLRMKLLDFIIRKELSSALQEKINALSFLNDFKSKYTSYNFLEEKIYSASESKNLKKENLFFRLTYLRDTEESIIEEQKTALSPLKIEFTNKQFLKLGSPYSSMDTSNKFVAVIGGADIIGEQNSFDFFNPTILAILSDLDYIDNNIIEIDPFYCPTPQSLQPDTEINKQKYQNDNVIKDASPFSKNKNLVDSNPKAFNFINFPSLYFLPNIYPDALSFYDSTKENLSRDKAERIILQHSKYYYESSADTPSSKLIRDPNSNELFRKTLLNNGFYGPYEARKDSFADTISLEQIIKKLSDLTTNQGIESLNQLQDIVFARTNLSCLLREFQTCYLPKAGNCRDILRGFRFSELENILKKAFPESVYTEFYNALIEFKINNIKDEREKKLLDELRDLENAIKNNERKQITFAELDKRTEPGKALDIADQKVSKNGDPTNTLQQQYENKLKEYRDLKSEQESVSQSDEDRAMARKEMNPEEMKMIDDFLDLMERYGLNVDILCSIVDLFNISFETFNFLQLPKFPTVDLFQEVKLSLDLTVVKIILDSIVAFILKILNELLTCGGIKGLISAALTGDANGSVTGATLSALNQIGRGKFDLDDFVNKNPQIDPIEYHKSFINIAKSLNPPLKAEEFTALNINLDFGVFGNTDLTAKSKTKQLFSHNAEQILSTTKSSSVTELEIKQSLVELISELCKIMQPDAFIRMISGSPNEEDLRQADEYVRKQHSELTYLLVPGGLSGIFSYLAKASGLDLVREEIVAMSSYYSSYNINQSNLQCLDPTTPEFIYEPKNTPADQAATAIAASVPFVVGSDDIYRNLIQDLLSCSPGELKNKIEDKVFKPLLIGRLPNGKSISAVEKATSEIVDINFKIIANNFKDGCNQVYSNLVLKKPVKREVKKFLKQESSEEPKEYENPEYNDLINKGGYVAGTAPDTIEIEEQKFVYGGLFVENFNKSSKNLSINSDTDTLSLSLTGTKGYSSTTNSQFALHSFNDSCWKIENTLSKNKNTIKLYEGNVNNQNIVKFNFEINNENVDINSIYQETLDTKERLKEILKSSIIQEYSNLQQPVRVAFDKKFAEYTSHSYNTFLSLIYEKIANSITKDGLLQPINLDSLQKEKYITGIKDGLDSVFPGLSLAMQNNSLPPMVSPNIDTPMKYINFCPKPTKKQKDLKIDPGLFGKYELEQFISQIIDKRKNDIVDTKTLEQMLKDDDNYLKFGIIDGLYISLIRTACVEVCMRAIFPLRVFKYNKKLIDDLMLPTYVAQTLYNEINYKFNSLNKDSLIQLTQNNINYIHSFIFSEELNKPENSKLFKEIKKLKTEISLLEEDMDIMNSYLGKLYTESPLDEQDKQYKKKVENQISCIKSELKEKYNKILILQLRNICYNEMIVIFDKLSYLTSTNEKIKNSLSEQCSDEQQNVEDKDFLSMLIPELLIKTELQEVTTVDSDKRLFTELQKEKLKPGPNLIIEHYVNVPEVKTEGWNTFDLALKQKQLNCYGAQPFSKFQDLLSVAPEKNKNLNQYFSEEIKYGMRLVYIPDIDLKEQTSIQYEQSKTIRENFDSLCSQGKAKFYLEDFLIDIGLEPSSRIRKDEYEKTYIIPFIGEPTEDGKRKFGVINAFPIIKESINVSTVNIKTVSDMLEFLPKLKIEQSNELTNLLKLKISCSEELKSFYSIFTNENLLSNLTILSSISILSGDTFVTPFRSIRKQIMNSIHLKFTSIYNNSELEDIRERMSTTEYFKEFNAPLAAKSALKAAIYVLQYYCQMTDPNISLALILRNAVKLSLSLASQIPNPFGGPPVPSELPLALSPLAIYSMAQLPITVFGVPPVGIGVGPPLTIPGMVLLGADLLLLSLEFSENLDLNIENDSIKEELKNYCFDLSGYKKYGV